MTHTASSTADRTVGATAPKILVVGGGYAGFYTAWKLEKLLRAGEAEVTIVDPLPYMASCAASTDPLSNLMARARSCARKWLMKAR